MILCHTILALKLKLLIVLRKIFMPIRLYCFNQLIYENIKEKNIFGLLNNIDFKLIDELNESCDKTTSETKINEEELSKDNGMKSFISLI